MNPSRVNVKHDLYLSKMIPFNKPFLTGHETEYILNAVNSMKISGDGQYSKKCHQFFEKKYNFRKTFLTTSCTDALEMAAILINIQPGDEVIVPTFTFVSTVNAFVLRGAKIVFIDSMKDNPNMDANLIEDLITSKTKAIVPVHYAGVACNMKQIMEVANKHGLYVVEDAAQAIDSYFIHSDGKKQPLGSFGHLATFSFHETKNIVSGEGGLLVVNDESMIERAEIIREKGTNRSKFFRGEVDKYNWIDIGSSFLPSDIIAAFLFAQLEKMDEIQKNRISIWNAYQKSLLPIAEEKGFTLPNVPAYATNNGHMYYLLCDTEAHRSFLIDELKKKNINAVFHYLSLSDSPYFKDKNEGKHFPNATFFEKHLVRLPFYYQLNTQIVTDEIKNITK